MEMKTMSKKMNNDVDAFLSELEEIDTAHKAARADARGPRTVYEVIKPEMGKVYSGYTLVSYNETTSPLGSESLVLRCVAPGNDGESDAGRRVKFYLNGYEKQDFERFVRQNNLVVSGEDGKNTYNLPVSMDFLRKMNESQKNAGRTFKSFHGIIRDADSATLREAMPAVPDDQQTTEPYVAPVHADPEVAAE
tara:strand:+ start:328 stop:906 length:579 start_codon:yes stop_codon:yes gene_type:complete